ncbi:hypothetical protein [Oceanobacillus locisalsi]|uniref:Cytochrome P450 n=1 Tax=Oceanobacillus locisalsi TaxID=546107 RepID=A0ABW3NF09_9BACI
MRMFLMLAMIASVMFVIVTWRYKILNYLLNWKPGRKYLVPFVGNMLIRKQKKEAV